MARSPRRSPRPGRGRRRPAVEEPTDEGAVLDQFELPAETADLPISLGERQKRRDLLILGGLTPIVVLGLIGFILLLSSQFVKPDPNSRAEITRAAAESSARRATPTIAVVVEPIDPTRLNAGVVEKPPAFRWPEVEDWKFIASPGKPDEQAEYTPLIASTDLRRLVAAASVGVTRHGTADQAKGAAKELAKSYPLRSSSANVLGIEAYFGFIPDDSGFGLATSHEVYRIHIELTAATGPIKPEQRADFEYHTLHLADHIARRVQETLTSAFRTGVEAQLTHYRDHIGRRLPGGR
ncbi:MAG: hypothetical protein EPO26_01635 [Chloroflexota bacterium]|nr:MAG: hypothetical protein EPO26_01635 [Chloroflexota bacterium]